MYDMPPPAVGGGEVAAAPLLRGYESRIQSRIQTRIQSRIQSRIQTPTSQAKINAPNVSLVQKGVFCSEEKRAPPGTL